MDGMDEMDDGISRYVHVTGTALVAYESRRFYMMYRYWMHLRFGNTVSKKIQKQNQKIVLYSVGATGSLGG
jgi:hypothetical protein